MKSLNNLFIWRNYIVFITIALYLVLNQGFMQLTIIPFVPIGEMVLIFALLTINYKILYKKINSFLFMLPFIIWWIYGISYILISFINNGIWALRDGSHVIESLFLIVGFVCVSKPVFMEKFFKWIPVILVIISMYSLGFKFRHELTTIFVSFNSFSGVRTSFLFNYINTATILLLSLSYVYLFFNKKNLVVFFSALIIFAYLLLVFHTRTIYLQIIGLLLILLLYRRKNFIFLIFSLIIIFFVLYFFEYFKITIIGRMNHEVTVDFMSDHFLTIMGVESKGLEGPLVGTSQRLLWWSNLYEKLTSNYFSFFFGLGYGEPLIKFNAFDGQVVREPHNSFISIISRGGIILGIMWAWMHFLLISIWKSAYDLYRSNNNLLGENRLLLLLVFFILILIFSIGQDAFEKPFNAIPYYFFWGVLLRIKFNQVNKQTPKNLLKSN